MQPLKNKEKIFINRSLNLESITSIGFDMDHTLALYNRVEFETLAFRETLKKFNAAGYPKELQKLKFDPNFVIRGLLVDQERGNLLKVDGYKYVKVAYHGHRRLDKQERHLLYNSKGYKADEFLSIDTFFALSEVQLFTEIVDYMRLHPGAIQKTYREVYQDLREFIDLSHKDGTIKQHVLSDISRYISRDPHLSQTLAKLIDGGKRLFLLTNSDWSYTNAIMSFLLNQAHEDFPKWQDYFEFSIVGGGKPDFFTGSNPFFEVVQGGLLKPHIGKLTPGCVYHGGNARLFEKLTNQTGDGILYIGDHIYGDIMRSKELFNWRTLLVVEELEEEFDKIHENRDSMLRISEAIAQEERLIHEYHALSADLSHHKRKQRLHSQAASKANSHLNRLSQLLHKKEQELKDLSHQIREQIEEREEKFHPIWGELMYMNLKKSRFAKQIEAYACLYTSKISNFRFYSPSQNFRSVRDYMPHDLPSK